MSISNFLLCACYTVSCYRAISCLHIASGIVIEHILLRDISGGLLEIQIINATNA